MKSRSVLYCLNDDTIKAVERVATASSRKNRSLAVRALIFFGTKAENIGKVRKIITEMERDRPKIAV